MRNIKRILLVFLLLLGGVYLFPVIKVLSLPFPTVRFENSADVYQCSSGDTVRLEGSSVRWDTDYPLKQFRACTKQLAGKVAVRADTIRFKMKSTVVSPLWFQVEEKSGEGFYKIITPTREWKTFSVRLASLTLNGDKVVNRNLDIADISKIHLIDPAAAGGQNSRSRSIWFSDWEFLEEGIKSQNSAVRSKKLRISKSKLRTGKVGLTAVPQNYQEDEENWLKVFQRAEELGVQIINSCGGSWSEQEKSPGVYNWNSQERVFSVIEKHDFNFEFTCDIGGVFFHDKVTQIPKDIKFKSFTEPIFLSRYRKYLTSFLDRFGSKVHYIAIHAEGAFNYFNTHPNHLDDYIKFLSAVRDHIKKHSSHIQVGVNTDPPNKDQVLSRMAEVTDFMSYDILRLAGHLEKPSDLESVTARLIRLSNGKKIAFQNAGWSTSEVENSSEAQQAEFIGELYRVLYKFRDKIEYASFYYLYDEDFEFMRPVYKAMFPDVPDSFREKMVESNGRFGVFRPDETAKPGWNELTKQIREYYKKVKDNPLRNAG